MGSNIPAARNILSWALQRELDLPATRKSIRLALALMTRATPAFRVAHDSGSLTPAAKAKARRLRQRGWSTRRIAELLKTNGGRVSEAINE